MSYKPDLTFQEIFPDHATLNRAMCQAAETGHAFGHVIGQSAVEAMIAEVALLDLQEGDHISKPIYEGTKKEIRQLHDRAYHAIGDPEVPVATLVTHALAERIHLLANQYPELKGWMATEAGYQLYRDDPNREYHISRHRDRRNDQLLSATITITGSAMVRMFEPIGDPEDYTDKNVRKIDEFRTTPGCVMFLRAPGLGSGEQTIHEVLPPDDGDRLILNLRMRPDILPSPDKTI